jgi:AcrR family transcriptional regulator
MDTETSVPPQPRREALIQAGFTQLAQRGFEGLRTRDVAAATGVNIATLHYYFPTKEALIGGILEHTMARFRTTIAPAASRGDLLRAHFAGLRQLVQNEPEIFTVMGELALRSARDPEIADLFGKTIETWHRTMRGLIESASKEGSLSVRVDPDVQASLVVSAVMGACMIPVNRSARLAETFRALEDSLGMRPRGNGEHESG